MVIFQNLSKMVKCWKMLVKTLKKFIALIIFYTLDIKNIIFNPKFYQQFLPSLLITVFSYEGLIWTLSLPSLPQRPFSSHLSLSVPTRSNLPLGPLSRAHSIDHDFIPMLAAFPSPLHLFDQFRPFVLTTSSVVYFIRVTFLGEKFSS